MRVLCSTCFLGLPNEKISKESDTYLQQKVSTTGAYGLVSFPVLVNDWYEFVFLSKFGGHL